ncbi:phosphomannomutase/phosphoglucomutase [Patescibacteria group bacterium]|nr:phosphomannomutase/phosphoglucomutase [Patescibacteria group bacterium]
MTIDPSIFKSYDVRGVYPKDFNEDIAYKITQSYIKLINPKKVVLGKDVRESGPSLYERIEKSFLEAGVDVLDIGTVSTDEFYFAVGNNDVDGGITISASHNPREYNGMNFCKRNAVPISGDSGLSEIKDMVLSNNYSVPKAKTPGKTEKLNVRDDFIKKSASFINVESLKPMKIVANANFGVDYLILKRAVELFNLPLTLIPLNEKPDGTFPKGPPNPLLPENRKETLELIKKQHADLGVSWDADGDRCFFADENGNFIEGYFITAILAKELLKKNKGAKVVIDPRLIWATSEEIKKSGGTPIISKPGMTVIAARMAKENAIFAGEMSSHFYFKQNFFRDNGIIPLFLILEMLSKYDTTLSKLALPYTSKYFISGEINFETAKKDEIIKKAQEEYNDGKIEFIDGLSVEYPSWRFNLRKSNTEPLLRLNLEAKTKELQEEKTKELVKFIKDNS